MSSNKIETRYVSPIDQFLQAFDRQHPEKSLSQQKEIAKAQRITRLRDCPLESEQSKKLWEDF